MAINKIVSSFDEAVADIHNGATVLMGGFGTVASCPSMLVEALARKGSKDLTTVSNTGGYGADVWKIQGYVFAEDIDILHRNRQVKKAIVSAPSSAALENTLERRFKEGKVELEKVPLGTLSERIRLAKPSRIVTPGVLTPMTMPHVTTRKSQMPSTVSTHSSRPMRPEPEKSLPIRVPESSTEAVGNTATDGAEELHSALDEESLQ